jgi:hypothetical protein
VPSATPCDEQNRLSPEVSRYYENLVLARMRSVRGRAGQTITIVWTITDNKGYAIDLRECGFPDASESSFSSSSSSSAAATPRFLFRIREHLSLGFQPEPLQTQFDVYLENAENGRVRIELPAAATGLPGVYYGEVAVVDAEGLILFTNVFYVVIERGQFGAARHTGGPPAIAELKLHLRDSSPEESLLLDNIKFDDAEIALAIGRPIDYWNEIPPPLNQRATTQNFPFRFHWMDAIVANLFWMLEEQFRANNLTYSAAGVQVNDQDKEPNYARAAERRWANWVDFVRRKKASINLESAYGGIGSSYRATAYSYRY